MYALLAALSAASTFFAIRASRFTPHASRFLPLAPYVLTAAAGLYTHYAFPFILLVHNVVFGLWWLTTTCRSAHRWRWLALWARAQTAVVVLYLPWLPVALKSVTGWSSAGRAYELGPALLNVRRVLNVGLPLPVAEGRAALIGAGILLPIGLWPALSRVEGPRRTARAGWWSVTATALYLLLPITLIFAFDLYKSTWLKFLVVVLPSFHLLLAHGIENLTRLVIRGSGSLNARCPMSVRFLVILLFAVPTLPSLRNLYFDPAYARDDYRRLAADISTILRSGDGIILDAPNQWEVFTYYYPDRDVHPAPYRPVPDEVEAFLTPLVERYRRLFVLYWGDAESDPQRLIETWLAAHTYQAGDRWYGRVRLATYGVAPLPDEPAATLDARFGEAVGLNGYALVGERFAPGDTLPVTLFWKARSPITERYKVTVQLLDGAGQLVAQRDSEPGDGLMPTTTWEPGQILADRYGVSLPPDLPPGHYTLIVGLYHIATGERSPVTLGGEPSGDHLILCGVEVVYP